MDRSTDAEATTHIRRCARIFLVFQRQKYFLHARTGEVRAEATVCGVANLRRATSTTLRANHGAADVPQL